MRRGHVSGFSEAAGDFERMAVDEIWLPASEDPSDEYALSRARRRRERLRELSRVTRALPDSAADLGRSLSGVVNLFGECQDPGPADKVTGGESPADTLASRLSRGAGQRRLRYLDARASPLSLFDDLPDVYAYILGPSRAAGREVSDRGAGAAPGGSLDLAGSFLAAARSSLGLSANDDPQWRELLERNLPFPPSLQTKLVSAGGDRAYTPDVHAEFFEHLYFHERESWRRIDSDWMGVARGLALALDHEANSASLALAIELSPNGKVFLFPGDSQLDAWRSWGELSWPSRDGATRITAGDLLRRTAVYKIAHHCSQTGTLLVGGLESMGRGDLVALLPVDRATAESLNWDMPYPPLLKRLREKTRGRVLLSDPREPGPTSGPRPEELSESEWQAFKEAVRETDLYTEYSVGDALAAEGRTKKKEENSRGKRTRRRA